MVWVQRVRPSCPKARIVELQFAHKGRGGKRLSTHLAGEALVTIALKREHVGVGGRPLRAEAAAALPPFVERPVGKVAAVTIELLAVDAPEDVVASLPSITDSSELTFFGAAAGFDEQALRIGRPLGYDVDHAVHRVGPQTVAPGPRMTSMRSMSSRG